MAGMEANRDSNPAAAGQSPAASRPGMTRVLARNIRALEERRQKEEAEARWSERVAMTMPALSAPAK